MKRHSQSWFEGERRRVRGRRRRKKKREIIPSKMLPFLSLQSKRWID